MDKHLRSRIEKFGRSESESHYLRAHIMLAEILELESPKDDWESRLNKAREDLYAATMLAATPNEYYRSAIALDAAPLYTLPLLDCTIDRGVLKKNMRCIRKGFIGKAVEISEKIAMLNLSLDNLECEELELVNETIDDLVGVGSEVAVLAALLNTELYRKGYVPVPSLPWQDRRELDLLHYRYQGNDVRNTSFDILLMPLSQTDSEHKIQVKAKYNGDRQYADDISVISAASVVHEIAGFLPITNKKPAFTLYDLYAALPNAESRVRASKLACSVIEREVFKVDTSADESLAAG